MGSLEDNFVLSQSSDLGLNLFLAAPEKQRHPLGGHSIHVCDDEIDLVIQPVTQVEGLAFHLSPYTFHRATCDANVRSCILCWNRSVSNKAHLMIGVAPRSSLWSDLYLRQWVTP
jgi:hypothetical protein